MSIDYFEMQRDIWLKEVTYSKEDIEQALAEFEAEE